MSKYTVGTRVSVRGFLRESSSLAKTDCFEDQRRSSKTGGSAEVESIVQYGAAGRRCQGIVDANSIL